ncbi:MAG TPA: oligosaccharide flippase family protein [Bacteroidales bacterium]|nr:oligosaccharide flippase family protein [Bacteroidales bacterium]
MQKKDFVFNVGLLIFLNLLIKPFWILGIDVGVQNSVGASQYGLYFAVFNFTFLFNMILDMGITNFNNRNIARHNQLLQKHLSGILTLKLLLGLIYIVVTLLAALLIGYKGLHLKILFWTALNQFLNTFILYLRSNISALLLFKTDSFLSILDRLLMIFFCGILLWGNITTTPFQIEWFVYCQTAAYLISAIIALLLVIKKAKLQRLYWNLPFFRLILKKSFPFAILFLLMSFYNRIDSVMIERILPSNIATFQAGVYASAFRLLDALVMISYLFSVILLPLFSKMLKQKEDLTGIIKTSFSLLFFFSVTTVTLLILYREPILSLLYKEHIFESSQVFRFLIPCLIPISFTYIFGTLLTANGNMRLLNITSIAGIGVNVLVNIFLIPHFQAVGAAIASLSTQSLVCILQIIIVFKELKLSFSKIPYMNCLFYTIILVPSVYIFSKILPYNPLIILILSSFFALFLAFVTRLIPLKSLKELKLKI